MRAGRPRSGSSDPKSLITNIVSASGNGSGLRRCRRGPDACATAIPRATRTPRRAVARARGQAVPAGHRPWATADAACMAVWRPAPELRKDACVARRRIGATAHVRSPLRNSAARHAQRSTSSWPCGRGV